MVTVSIGLDVGLEKFLCPWLWPSEKSLGLGLEKFHVLGLGLGLEKKVLALALALAS